MLGEPTALNIALNVASNLASLVVLGCAIFVIVKCFQKDKAVHGVLGIVGMLLCCLPGYIYTFIYGWAKAGEWRIQKVMAAYTASLLVSVGTLVYFAPMIVERVQLSIQQAQAEAEKARAGSQPGDPVPPVDDRPAPDPLPEVPAPANEPEAAPTEPAVP